MPARNGTSNWRDRIVIDAKIHHGDPCIRGTRIPVSVVVASIADGDPVDRILEAYPALTREDVKAALKFAAEAVNTADFIQRTTWRTRSRRCLRSRARSR